MLRDTFVHGHGPAQARAKMIGGYQTRNGQGQITGISKVTQALGQVKPAAVVKPSPPRRDVNPTHDLPCSC